MKHDVILRKGATGVTPDASGMVGQMPYLLAPPGLLRPSELTRQRAAFEVYQNGLKRWMDIAGCLLLAPLALVVVGILWCLVRLDGGPGFFAHTRVGRGGVPFRCWKLRTMCVDAEARLKQHLECDPVAAREWADRYKLEQDPRITGLGAALRRSSLDELPQLWNVLKGEMSLVGPRPVPAAELAEYTGYVWAYLAARPGITGLWQVSGRNALGYSTRVGLDLRYVLEAGLWQDLRILGRTLGEVWRRSGS